MSMNMKLIVNKIIHENYVYIDERYHNFINLFFKSLILI